MGDGAPIYLFPVGVGHYSKAGVQVITMCYGPYQCPRSVERNRWNKSVLPLMGCGGMERLYDIQILDYSTRFSRLYKINRVLGCHVWHENGKAISWGTV